MGRLSQCLIIYVMLTYAPGNPANQPDAPSAGSLTNRLRAWAAPAAPCVAVPCHPSRDSPAATARLAFLPQFLNDGFECVDDFAAVDLTSGE